jgi:cell wall-associated NlpC family hydrolase
MTRTVTREEIVQEAMSWLKTPYRHMGRVRGSGVDCATFLAEVYANVGAIEPAVVDFYPQDWMQHNAVERYVQQIFQNGVQELWPPAVPLPGDVCMWKFGRCFSHSAIVIDWPRIIHAYMPDGVTLDSADNTLIKHRPMRLFRLEQFV